MKGKETQLNDYDSTTDAVRAEVERSRRVHARKQAELAARLFGQDRLDEPTRRLLKHDTSQR